MDNEDIKVKSLSKLNGLEEKKVHYELDYNAVY